MANINGTTGADNLQGTSGADSINAESGNDSVQIISSKSDVNGGSGNDTYHVNTLSQDISITDTAGENDLLNINAKKSAINIIFDVNKNDLNADSKMYIMSDSSWSKIQKYQNIDKMVGGIEISSSDSLETIKAKDGYVTTSQIAAVKSQIAEWLSTTDHSTAMEALTNGSEQEVQTLIAYYEQINWQ